MDTQNSKSGLEQLKSSDESQSLELTDADKEVFVRALADPPKPSTGLKKAASKHKAQPSLDVNG